VPSRNITVRAAAAPADPSPFLAARCQHPRGMGKPRQIDGFIELIL